MKHLVIGGAGFIGVNTSYYFLQKGEKVIIFDNLSRKGTIENLVWLQHKFPQVSFISGDIRLDQEKLNHIVCEADVIYHLAAQVAVTTSVKNPREDFEINTLGTFNVLEAIRKSKKRPILIYASTNKVYGGMEDIKIVDKGNRYEYKDLPFGIPEDRLLDFHSPYGCSKGAADQYVRDYARIYGLRTVVCRQSCIYGPRQFGVEDQGWVAWFTIATVLGKPITIYGDGKQIRDVLYVDDLVRTYEVIVDKIDYTAGKVYNIGGGPVNTLSLLELLNYLGKLTGKSVKYSFDKWRPGDQPVYVSDIRKAKKDLGWSPQISPHEGVRRLHKWATSNRQLFYPFFKNL